MRQPMREPMRNSLDMMFKKEITFDRFIRGLLTFVVVAVVLWVINSLRAVLLPFFVAWLMAYMIYPLVKFFQYKLRMKNRVLSIAAALVLILAVLVGFFWLIVPPAVSEFMRFRDLLSAFIRETGSSVWGSSIEAFFREHIDENTVLHLLQENNVVDATRVALTQLWSLVSRTVDLVLGVLGFCIVWLYLFFILKDYEKLSSGWLKLVPARNRPFVATLLHDLESGMNAYFRGQALVAFLVGVLFSIGFLIIGFPLAVGLGMFIGFLNLVPYLQVVGVVPTLLLAVLQAQDTGENFWLVLLSAGMVFVVVQVIQDMVLIPRIMGKIMGLNPAVILLSLSVWGSLMGVIGLIVALPLTTLILSYYRRFVIGDETFLKKRLSDK